MRFTMYGASKGYERVLEPLLSEGAERHGDSIEMRPLESYVRPEGDGTIIIGIVRRQVLWDHVPLRRIPCLYIDKGFTRERADFRGQNIPKWWRFCFNAVHPTRYLMDVERPHDRLQTSGLLPLAERTESRDGPIVLAGSSEKFHATMRLPHPTEWASDIIRQIRDSGDTRMVIYRPKPSWADAEAVDGATFDHGAKTQIGSVLADASLMITYGSIASVDAIKAGVPCVVLGNAPARPVSSTSLLQGLREPVWRERTERVQWAANLAYCHFRPAELADGTAWRIMKEKMDAVEAIR